MKEVVGSLRRVKVVGAALGAMLALGSHASALELRWGVWAGNPEQAAVWQQLADLVEEKHPDITLSLETAPWGAYWDKLTTQLASGTAPDIVSLHHMFFANYAANDLLMDITPLVEQSSDLNYDDFYKAARDGLSDESATYGLPYGIAPFLLYYNKDLFDAAGVPYPDPREPMTFDQFIKMVDALDDPENGVFGYTQELDIMGVIPFMLSNGGDYISDDGSRSRFDDPASIEGLRVSLDRFKPGGGAAPVVDLANPTGIDQFARGEIAMTLEGSWQMGVIGQRGAANWDIAPVPAGAAGSVTWSGVSGFAPSKTTPNVEAAWRAVMTLTSKEALEIIGSSGREFPARLSALDSWLNSPIAPDNAKLIPAIFAEEGAARAKPLIGGVHWPAIWNLTLRELGPGYLGTADAADVATSIANEMNAILSE